MGIFKPGGNISTGVQIYMNYILCFSIKLITQVPVASTTGVCVPLASVQVNADSSSIILDGDFMAKALVNLEQTLEQVTFL